MSRDLVTRRSAALGRFVLALGAVLFGFASASRAEMFDSLQLEGWYGEGVNKAVLVVDFSPSDGDSFAFGLRFGDAADETITGFEMLQRVRTGTSNAFNFASTYWGVELGNMIDEMWYTDPETSVLYDAAYDWPNTWWSYWLSDDAGSTWQLPMIDPDHWLSADTRLVGNNDTDGWLAKPGDDATSLPVAPVPEPGTLVLVAAGIAAALVRRLRRTAD